MIIILKKAKIYIPKLQELIQRMQKTQKDTKDTRKLLEIKLRRVQKDEA